MGVGAVCLLYLTVRRWAGAGAGLLAGLALAVTPVATLMFRFNNPDAMLVLLMVAAVYATVRAIDAARTPGRHAVAAAGRRPGRSGLPDQEPAGAPRRARRSRWSTSIVAPDTAAPPAVPAPGGRSRDARLGPVVGRRGDADPGLVPAVHRRLAAQQRVGADLGLQRPGPADRQRDRQRRRRRRDRRRDVGLDRPDPAVRQRHRRPDRLAAAGGARPARRRPVVHPPGSAHRPLARAADRLGRLAARHRPDLQRDEGDLPPVLHGGPRPGRRRSRRGRCRLALARTSPPHGCSHPRRHGRADRRLVLRPARPEQLVAPVAALRGPGGRPGRGPRPRRRAAPVAPGGRRCGRAGRGEQPGRPRGVLGADRVRRAQRLDRHRRSRASRAPPAVGPVVGAGPAVPAASVRRARTAARPAGPPRGRPGARPARPAGRPAGSAAQGAEPAVCSTAARRARR